MVSWDLTKYNGLLQPARRQINGVELYVKMVMAINWVSMFCDICGFTPDTVQHIY